MRIIHRGTPPTPRPRWQYEVDLTCPHCGTVFRLEPGDRHKVVDEWRPVERQSVRAECPVCDFAVTGTPGERAETLGSVVDTAPAAPRKVRQRVGVV